MFSLGILHTLHVDTIVLILHIEVLILHNVVLLLYIAVLLLESAAARVEP